MLLRGAPPGSKMRFPWLSLAELRPWGEYNRTSLHAKRACIEAGSCWPLCGVYPDGIGAVTL